MFVNTTMDDEDGGLPAEPLRRKAATTANMKMSKRGGTRMKRVSAILRKKNESRTQDDRRVLEENAELVKEYHKRRERRAIWSARKAEQEDTKDDLQAKSEQLAQAIHDAEFLVVYTGAGISTAASIPDYRGPNGIWTLLQKGQDIGNHDLSTAEPTVTHMALSTLYQQGTVRHVVSQNCDGLHLRSGLPKSAMSEVHGNMYIEVCQHCVPAREYVRTFDVTERTSTYKHTTGRRCYRCGEPLIDTIVHFGERGQLRWPLNWQGACQAANACDTILCLGSSLKVLKKYPWLWQMDRPPKKRPRLYIINLQWTPKDKDATLKINGKCDEVMAAVMKALGYELPYYSRSSDPIFSLGTRLHTAEAATSTRPRLVPPSQHLPGEGSERETLEDGQQGLDVRWDVEGGGGQEQEEKDEKMKKRKLENVDEEDVKDDKLLIKDECTDNVKPLNGVSTSWLLLKDKTNYDVKGVKSEDPSEDSKHILNSYDEIKSECDIKEEEDKQNKSEEVDIATKLEMMTNGLSIPNELSHLYRALTAGNIKPGPGHPVEELFVSADEEEVKSESPDSNEDDFQVSDTEGEAWPSDRLVEPWQNDRLADNMADRDALSLKSSDSCCSYSESEKEDDCQAEECQTEDSQAEDSQAEEYEMDDCNESQPVNEVDYLKLAYSSTNVRMARQGQALLKQNDFYGTGLCIRSFINFPKAESQSDETVATEAQGMEQSPDTEINSAPDLPMTPEIDGTSLPCHTKCSTLVLSSSDRNSGEIFQCDDDSQDNMEENSSDHSDRDTNYVQCINSVETTVDQFDNAESRTITEYDGSEKEMENLEQLPENDMENLEQFTENDMENLEQLPENDMENLEQFTENYMENVEQFTENDMENVEQFTENDMENIEQFTENDMENVEQYTEKEMENLEQFTENDMERSETTLNASLPLGSVNNIVSLGNADELSDAAKVDYVLHHLNQDLAQSSSQDGSFLLRTHVVDGVIRTACVETMSKEKSVDEEIADDTDRIACDVPSSLSELARISVPCLRLQRALIPTANNSALCKTNPVSEPQLQTMSHSIQHRNFESKFSSRLNTSDRDELKSIWYQSFCGSNSENSLGALAVMMGVKECDLNKGLGNNISYLRPHGSNTFQSPENSSSVILKNICAETVSDSAAKHKGSAKKKLKGSDNEDVKYIWFWGFDSNIEQKEKESEKGEESDDSDGVPMRRVTRSRTRASCDSQSVAPVVTEPDEFVCHCSGRNPELCRIASLRPLRYKCDEDVQKARDIINRRRTYNYRKYEPIFEKQMQSLTYERAKAKRKSKFESGNNNEVDDDYVEQEQDSSEVKEDDKVSDGEDIRERDEKGERKITPGWYGKGLRKGMKKKTRV